MKLFREHLRESNQMTISRCSKNYNYIINSYEVIGTRCLEHKVLTRKVRLVTQNYLTPKNYRLNGKMSVNTIIVSFIANNFFCCETKIA